MTMGGGVMKTVAKAAASVGYRSTAGHAPLLGEWDDSDEWELAGGEEELVLFGTTLRLSPPSLEEAKEATSDLKDVLGGLYPPHVKSSCLGSSVIESRTGSSKPLYLELDSDVKVGCAAILAPSAAAQIIQPFSLPPSVPGHILKAFSLLQKNPDVQSIVAALAVDEKIWDAVMNNEKVLSYCTANYISSESSQERVSQRETTAKDDVPSPVDEEGSPQRSEQRLVDFMHALRMTVKDMVSNLSHIIESFMRPRETAGGISTAVVRIGTAGDRSFGDMATGASFVALTIATIIVIILKRGEK